MKPLTSEELFSRIGIAPSEPVSWNDLVTEQGPGVYVITIADLPNAEFDARFEACRNRWNPDQMIVYIGRARHLSRRLRQFFRHIYGAKGPHRGGQDILLINAPKTIHWAAVTDCADAERRLLDAFQAAVGRKPFGNRIRSSRDSQARLQRAETSIG